MEQTNKAEKVQLNLLLPICQRDKLRKMAAEMTLENPSQVMTAATIAKEIIGDYLDRMQTEELKNDK
jgi:hypothetical protein